MEIFLNQGDALKGDKIAFECKGKPIVDKRPKSTGGIHRIQGGLLNNNVYCVIDKPMRSLRGSFVKI